MMHTVSIEYAKANFSQLIELALKGKRVEIQDDSGPSFTLSCIRRVKGRRIGIAKGLISQEEVDAITEALLAPLPDHILAAFEGR
ncbi:type II toxin-antitoxin system Phd/YefM family antitoxin [Caballeronia sp. HLA56]